MESVMTVRLNGDMKERAAAIMRREGYTPSSAVRRLFEYTVKHDGLPFEKSEKPDRDELRRRIEAFDQVHTKRPLTMSDEELREARLKDRYGASPVEAITPEELFARLREQGLDYEEVEWQQRKPAIPENFLKHFAVSLITAY